MGKKAAEKVASLPVAQVAQEQARTQVKRSNTLIKAMVYGDQAPPSAKDGAPQSLPESEFLNIAGEILEPPYDPYALIYMAETNGTLTAAVDAYEANIDSFGHRLVPRVDLASETISPEIKTAAAAEKRKILNFLSMVASRGGLTKLRRKTRADREYTGYAFWEVIRNRRSEVIEFNHIPSPQVRLCPEGEDVVEVKDLYLQLDENDMPVVGEKPIYRRFRRFVQAAYLASSGTVSTTCGTKIVWFKEYGDPRVLDNTNGKFYLPTAPEVTQDFEGSGKPMPESRRASEILFFSRYWPRTPYGVPRWIGDILAVVGKRAAAEVNFVTLKNNNIPSIAILVSNGKMTKSTVERIRTFFDTHVRGNANYAQALVLEGEGEYEGDESNHVKIDIKPLANMQHTDALFVEYTKQTNADLLRTFRLPPIFVGDSEAYNRSTSEVSRRSADEQVFAPERDEFDGQMNEILLRELKVRFWRFLSKTPNVTDNRDIVAILAAAERTGGSTPRIARGILNDVLQGVEEVPPLNKMKFDPDVPFSLTMAQLIGHTGSATEVNQTVAPVMPSGEVPNAQGPSGSLAKEFNLTLLKDLLSLGDKANAELEGYLRGT